MIDFKLFGMPELQAAMAQLPARIQDRVMKGAMATGASVFRKEAVLRAPMYTGGDEEIQGLLGKRVVKIASGHPPPGTLKRAIYQTRIPEQCSAVREVWRVAVRQGKSAQKVSRGKNTANLDAFYAGFVEFGHYTRTPKGVGTIKSRREAARASGSARWVPPKPFMRPAFEVKKSEAIQAVRDYIHNTLPVALQAAGPYLKAKS